MERAAVLAQEATDTLRDSKIAHGNWVEAEVAKLKMKQIVDPEFGITPRDINHNLDGVGIFIRGLLEDYVFSIHDEEVGNQVLILAGRMTGSVRKDIEDTVEEYDNLSFDPNSDPTMVAKDERERDIILEAARLMGYRIKETEKGVRVSPQQRYEASHIEDTIRTRVNIGLRFLFEDYDQPLIRRPVRRMIISMADHMATTLRNPARTN